MGSSSSKTRRLDGASSSCSSFSSSVSSLSVVDGAGSSNGTNRKRLRVRSVFQSSCLGSTSKTCDSDDENQIPNHGHEENGVADYGQELQRDELISDEMKMEYFQNLKVEQPDEMACVSSNVDLNEWIQSDRGITRSANSSPPPASSSQPLNLSSRFRSCFNMAPGNVSFRLSRANSLRSSREESHLPARPSIGAFDRHENQGDRNFHSDLSSTSPRQYHSGSSVNLPMDLPTSTSASSSLDCYPNFSTRSLIRDNASRRTRGDACSPYSRSREMQNATARHADGRNTVREPMDRNSRFSRTLSVGRLRDRVLRRPSFSDLAFPPLQQERVAIDSNEVHGINGSTVETRTNTADENPVVSFPSSYQVYGSQNLDNESSELRESRLPDILQQRSSFLERQRRIRSRVRALQRSRFETLSGHERSCILSGHHRTGRCTCHMNARGPNSNDDTGARASISRIVMLAEALFEVLDEIHQQSVALPSQPSVSSIGSIPAPVEVVESLPSKTYSKSTKFKSDEDGQCYICLVEYEDGDDMRILPCHHEFHRACVDKWLKEIHRVCPLCRGDICRSRSSLTES